MKLYCDKSLSIYKGELVKVIVSINNESRVLKEPVMLLPDGRYCVALPDAASFISIGGVADSRKHAVSTTISDYAYRLLVEEARVQGSLAEALRQVIHEWAARKTSQKKGFLTP